MTILVGERTVEDRSATLKWRPIRAYYADRADVPEQKAREASHSGNIFNVFSVVNIDQSEPAVLENHSFGKLMALQNRWRFKTD